VKYISFTSLNRIRSPISPFAPIKSFVHVNVKTDEVYRCKTATISFIFLSIVLTMSKILNINMPEEFTLISASQRNPDIQYCNPNNRPITLTKNTLTCVNDVTAAKALIGERILCSAVRDIGLYFTSKMQFEKLV
jgi:hypothetical protein